MDGQEFLANFDRVFFMLSHVKSSKLILLYYFIIFLHLILSLLHIIFSLVPYAHISIELIDCILLLLLALSSTLLTSSVNTLFLDSKSLL